MSLPELDSNGVTKVLVTGGAGFIGSNLCEKLLNEGFLVVCLDDLSTGHLRNISTFIENPKFQFIRGDIRDFYTCKDAVKGCRYVFHHAALGSVPRSIDNPLNTNSVNIDGFLNMIEASKQEGVHRFIFAASSSTYGDSKDLPKIEDKIGKPLSPYAVTKLVNELYADVYQKTYGLEFIGLRYFNVYGKNQDPDGAYAAVIPKFVKQFIQKDSPVINGDGSFSRDFTHIDNVVEANILAMKTANPLSVNQVYNVACGESTSLKSLAEMIRKILAEKDIGISDISISYGLQRVGDIPHSLASIDKIKNLLSYKPSVLIEAGLIKSINWYWEHV